MPPHFLYGLRHVAKVYLLILCRHSWQSLHPSITLKLSVPSLFHVAKVCLPSLCGCNWQSLSFTTLSNYLFHRSLCFLIPKKLNELTSKSISARSIKTYFINFYFFSTTAYPLHFSTNYISCSFLISTQFSPVLVCRPSKSSLASFFYSKIYL